MIYKLNGAGYIRSIDFWYAYYQVEWHIDSRLKTAFSTRTVQYCFNRMSLGLVEKLESFQELMEKVVITTNRSLVYLENKLVFTDAV